MTFELTILLFCDMSHMRSYFGKVILMYRIQSRVAQLHGRIFLLDKSKSNPPNFFLLWSKTCLRNFIFVSLCATLMHVQCIKTIGILLLQLHFGFCHACTFIFYLKVPKISQSPYLNCSKSYDPGHCHDPDPTWICWKIGCELLLYFLSNIL